MSAHSKRDLFELAIAYGLIEATIWTAGETQRTLFWVAAGWVVITSVLARRGWRELGLGASGFAQSLWVAGAALFLAAVAVLAARAGGTLHSLFGIKSAALHALSYGIWAEVQQFLAQSYFFVRVEGILATRQAQVDAPGGRSSPVSRAEQHWPQRLKPDGFPSSNGMAEAIPLRKNSIAGRRAVPLTAALFSFAHIPNIILVVVTLAGGLVLSEVFRRHRNIYALGFAHGLIGLILAVSVPDPLLRHMRVGLGYLKYGS